MNFLNILTQLAEVDPDVLDRLNPRRAVFSSLGTVAKRSAMAATPVLLASMFQKAYAGTNAGDPVEIFNYALTLELLESDFYKKMQASPFFATASAADQAAINQIAKHEASHVSLLTTVVKGIGGTPAAGVTFKTTTFATLTSFAKQLEIAQLLEDTGVRAYKGRATDLQGIADVNIPGVGTINPLESALRIHSVEARHAAHIRTMRMQTAWISGSGDLDGADNYKGATPESNVTQAGFNLTTAGIITPGVTYTAADVAASFDEILTKPETLALATPLIGA
ncbi:ferritin-like domain-containing protein [Hymenobacter sp. H14-R3]|uniref:ferritin-like domain-containing protein n=1 Tax=Hymenobacter sp. H14-R3 TaxID=3046308 RepID=UPI0024BB64B0|nr:ferritin-like domain-containing protein [Hymenobacter sp. H14-R3]MDJ0363647.1 ferritin-like domain-containing protein [Hymenobacter sp. H14-R3]